MEQATQRSSMGELLEKAHESRSGVSKIAESTSIQEAVKNAAGQATQEPKQEVKTEAKEEVSQEKKEESKQTQTDDLVPKSALFETRAKLREAKAKIKELESKTKEEESGDYWSQPDSEAEKKPKVDFMSVYHEDKFISTVNAVRREFKSAGKSSDEIFTKFDKLCDEDEKIHGERQNSLFHQAYFSADPGHFIVEFVEKAELEKKYGTDPAQMREKLRAELEAELSEKQKEDLRKKYNIKDVMPTDFGGSRVASGGHQTYNRPSARQLWDDRKYKKEK